MSSGGSENQPNPQPNFQPNFQIVGQYIKDLSFENPSAPVGFTSSPDMDLGIDLQARSVGPEHYEVVLSMRIKANHEGKPVFVLELSYAALVRLTNIPEDATQPILLIQAPMLMFPFVRRIVADVVRDGGMPPLVVEPIDFMALYQNRMAQAAKPPAGTA
jgi:preprotein translocase subunit SecB